jgi:ParB-like chromosome segregation protein Spo0J
MIPCIIIPAERSSVFRQAKENTARSGLSAIAMARQAALLLLTVHGYQIPDTAVHNDFYRQALELDLRGKREYTEAILSAMGGVKKGYLSYIKNLLKLSDEALELADRHNIEEYKLRYVVAVSPEYHSEIVRQIIDFNLTSKQVKELCEGDDLFATTSDPIEKLPAQAVRVARVTQSISSMAPQDIARALMQQEGDIAIARARLQALQKLLSEADRYLNNE